MQSNESMTLQGPSHVVQRVHDLMGPTGGVCRSRRAIGFIGPNKNALINYPLLCHLSGHLMSYRVSKMNLLIINQPFLEFYFLEVKSSFEGGIRRVAIHGWLIQTVASLLLFKPKIFSCRPLAFVALFVLSVALFGLNFLLTYLIFGFLRKFLAPFSIYFISF